MRAGDGPLSAAVLRGVRPGRIRSAHLPLRDRAARHGGSGGDAPQCAGALPLRLPRFLEGAMGKRTTCGTMAREWRRVVADAERELALLRRCELGQHVHLARLIAANGLGEPLRAAADRETRLARFLTR